MADLLLVHFALIPSPVRKERQFSLPDDFSGLDFTFPSRTSHLFSRTFSSFYNTDRPLLEDPQLFYTTRTEQKILTFPLSDIKVVAY